jgi:hypothetical protein
LGISSRKNRCSRRSSASWVPELAIVVLANLFDAEA